MPGSFYTLRCAQCEALHEISTGAGWSGSIENAWSFEQCACTSCLTLRSRRNPIQDEDDRLCSECRSDLVRWPGRVWLDQDDDGSIGAEHVERPCPQCGSKLTLETAEEFGLWD